MALYAATAGAHKGEKHSVAEWHLIIRETTDKTAKGTHVAVWKKGVADGLYIKLEGKGTGARKAAAPKIPAPVKAAAAIPSSVCKPVKYQVSDPSDTRKWKYVREEFDTEELRNKRLAEILADKANYDYRSKGWGDKKFNLSYWKLDAEEKN